MKFQIKHDITGRMRVHLAQSRLSIKDADYIGYYLEEVPGVSKVKVYERRADVVINYQCDRAIIIRALKQFQFGTTTLKKKMPEESGRALNAEYKEKLIQTVAIHYGKRFFLPAPIRFVLTTVQSIRYIWKGIKSLAKRKLQVEVLDATAIGVSILRGDYNTASSVMLLLGIGELLEEWTHKKSVNDLAKSMSLNISKVCLVSDGQEVIVEADQVKPGDEVVVRMGNSIPFDGVVTKGEAMVNQSSMTGEPLPVHKSADAYVYAGTVIEDGEITFAVKETSGSTRYEKIIKMIEETDKLKSSVESKAYRLADQLVPYTFLGTGITYLLTRNVTKMLSILMVDFSCALKLAIPISVLSAIREGSDHKITIKGGKFLEAVANVDTIVFDKTGTLTEAKPTFREMIRFCDTEEDELLKMAACMEEHFPHSMAKAVVDEAARRNIHHEEVHSKIQYIIAHGIACDYEGKRVVIGSAHFVFEDEKSVVPEGYEETYANLPLDCSHLYIAIEGSLVAVICVEDPLRQEAKTIVSRLKSVGIKKVVMMTGDSDRTAKEIARRVGVDAYYSEVLPEDKARFVEQERAAGNTVMMVGDGINDSPALSAANVGVAVSDGAEIAREIADITIADDSLECIVTLKRLGNGLMKRIKSNYNRIVGVNAGLIAAGVAGFIQPTTSALLHNTSTLMFGLQSMTNLLDQPVMNVKGDEGAVKLSEKAVSEVAAKATAESAEVIQKEIASEVEADKEVAVKLDIEAPVANDPALVSPDRILATRKAQNISQKALAEKTGISVKTLSKFEHGQTELSEEQIASLKQVLGLE